MRVFFTLITLIFIALSSSAQYDLKVTERNEKIANGNHNALVIRIYEADERDIEKGWKKELRKAGANPKIRGEIFGDDAQVKEMGENTFDVYAKTEKADGGATTFIVAFDLGGAFLNSSEHSKEFQYAKKWVREFAVEMTKEALGNQLKDVEKEHDDLTDEMEDLKKNKEDLTEEIKDHKEAIKEAESGIKEAEKNIKENEKNQEKKKKEIEEHQKVLDELKAKMDAVK